MKNKGVYVIMLFFINIVMCFSVSSTIVSCIKDADEEELTPPIKQDTIVVDTTFVLTDSTFRATSTFFYGEWFSEYFGFDPMQKTNSAIRRIVTFYSNGEYDSHVQGVNNYSQDNIQEYKEFEHEHGFFSFDEENQLMKYSVEYDSILNFFSDQLEFHAGKVIQGGGEKKEYNENIRFSIEKDGKRDWIRMDDNLMSVTDPSKRLVYTMKNQ